MAFDESPRATLVLRLDEGARANLQTVMGALERRLGRSVTAFEGALRAIAAQAASELAFGCLAGSTA